MNRWHVATLAALLLFSWCRAVDLEADLPSYYDTGISVTDEGTYMDAPKKRVTTGRWNLPGEWWHSQKLVPLYSFAMWKWFDRFGVGLRQGRSLSVVLGIGTLVVVAVVGLRLAGPVGGFALTALVGSSFILTHFSRAAMVETMQLFLLWILILLTTFRSGWFRNLAIGSLATSILLVKLSGAIALPGILVWLVFRDKQSSLLPRALAVAVGGVIPFLAVESLAPEFLARATEYSRQNFGGLLRPDNMVWHLLHIPVRSMFLSREAVAAVLALGAVFMAPGRTAFRHYRPYLWGLLGSVLLASLVDNATRRYLLFMPWLHLLALFGLLASSRIDQTSPVRDWLVQAGQLALTLLVVSGVPMVLAHHDIVWPKYWIGLAVVIAVFWILFRLGRASEPMSLALTPVGRRFALGMALILFAIQYGGWYGNRTHHTRDAIRGVAQVVDTMNPTPLIVGNTAPMFALESGAQAMFIHDKMGSPFDWPLPDNFLALSYVKPKLAYRMPADRELIEGMGMVTELGSWPIFPEKGVAREIALFETRIAR